MSRVSPCLVASLVASLVAVVACGNSSSAPVAAADSAAAMVDPGVVQMVARRDRLSQADARAQVVSTLRLASEARARANAKSADPKPLIRPDRAVHIVRGALARIWLDDVFAPAHGLDDIPADNPAYVAAAASKRFVHPELYLLCQLVAVPSGDFVDQAASREAANDPAWKSRAQVRIDAAARRMRRNVDPTDPGACELIAKLLQFETRDKDGVVVKYEQGAFDLEACAAKRAPDGACPQRQWAPEWTSAVEQANGPGFLPTFASRFGMHLVFVKKILPPTRRDDPATEHAIRESVGPQWQAEALETAIERLAEKRAVRVAVGVEPGAR